MLSNYQKELSKFLMSTEEQRDLQLEVERGVRADMGTGRDTDPVKLYDLGDGVFEIIV